MVIQTKLHNRTAKHIDVFSALTPPSRPLLCWRVSEKVNGEPIYVILVGTGERLCILCSAYASVHGKASDIEDDNIKQTTIRYPVLQG